MERIITFYAQLFFILELLQLFQLKLIFPQFYRHIIFLFFQLFFQKEHQHIYLHILFISFQYNDGH